mgnify:FL=1
MFDKEQLADEYGVDRGDVLVVGDDDRADLGDDDVHGGRVGLGDGDDHDDRVDLDDGDDHDGRADLGDGDDHDDRADLGDGDVHDDHEQLADNHLLRLPQHLLPVPEILFVPLQRKMGM